MVERGSAPASLASTPDDFFFPDPPLDAVKVPSTWSFRQESWTGHGEKQQHCQEHAYPERMREEVLREGNRHIAASGGKGELPATVRVPPLIFAVTNVLPAVVEPEEPLVKLVVCSEGIASRSGRDRLADALRGYASRPDFPYGEPVLVWRRVFRDGTEEFGYRWDALGVTGEKQATDDLSSRGFVLDPRDVDGAVFRHPGERVKIRIRNESLWWTGVR